MTERATTVFNSTNPIAHAALTRLAPLVLSSSKVQNKAAPRLGQISATTAGAPIAKGGGPIGDLQAGDRVPDVRARRRSRLYDLLDMSTLTLLVSGGAEPDRRCARAVGRRHRRARGVAARRHGDRAGVASRPARRLPRGGGRRRPTAAA